METRTIKVSIEKAKEWYKSGNLILIELALQAFTKKELEVPTFDEIALLVGGYMIPKEETILRTLSEYYKRNSDKFKAIQDKYFIAKVSYDGWKIIKHTCVLYPGIAYYLRKNDAEEALKIFLEEINYNK